MAVVKLKEVSIIGKLSELDKVATICGQSNVFHSDNAMNFYADTPDFTAYNEDNPYAEPLQQLNDAIVKANKTLTLLDTKETKNIHMDNDAMISYAKEIAAQIDEWEKEKKEAEDKIKEYTSVIDDMGHFVGLNLNLDEVNSCEFVQVRFGALPKENVEKLAVYKDNPDVIFTPCTTDDKYQWGVYFTPITAASSVDRIFSSLKFERVELNELKGSPEAIVADVRAKRDAEVALVKEIESKIESLWRQEGTKLQQVFSLLTEKNVYFTSICRNAARYDDNFVVVGWIPAKAESALKAELSKLNLMEVSFKGGQEAKKHNPPTKIKNAGIFRPFEFFVDMYGMPNYNEFDPTPFVAITYTILFGIMFGDLGQGPCIAIVGFLMWKLKKMAIGKILIPCGISSAFFGLVYGSVFGFEEWLNPMYEAMGIAGSHGKPIHVMDGATSQLVIYATIGFGALLIMIAMGIGIVSNIKQGHLEHALFGESGLASLMLYIGIIGFGLTAFLGWPIATFGGSVNIWVWLVILVFLPLIAILLKGILGPLCEGKPWKPASWGDYFMQSFFEIIVMFIEYLAHTMSFLRVGAFVLVHAGMMLVVFTLADMAAGMMPVYIIIVIIGNIIVTCLECLLVCIQVLRLQYYELFSRYYKGSGRKFEPVTVKAAE